MRSHGTGGEHPTEELLLAQMGWLECSPIAHRHCFNDLPAIYGTARNSSRPPIVQLLDYTNLMSRRTERARRIRAMPWGDVPGWPRKWNLLWLRWRQKAQAIVAGRVPTPCPGAVHWGGSMDLPTPRMVPVRCTAPTRNTFYAVR